MGAASSKEKVCIKVAAWINSSSSLNHHHRTSSFIFLIKQHAAAALATPSLMKLWIDALAWESSAVRCWCIHYTHDNRTSHTTTSMTFIDCRLAPAVKFPRVFEKFSGSSSAHDTRRHDSRFESIQFSLVVTSFAVLFCVRLFSNDVIGDWGRERAKITKEMYNSTTTTSLDVKRSVAQLQLLSVT